MSADTDKWIKRPDGSIDLEAQFKREFYKPSKRQRAYIAGIEAIELVSHKQAASIVLMTAHTMFTKPIERTVKHKDQLYLFTQ